MSSCPTNDDATTCWSSSSAYPTLSSGCQSFVAGYQVHDSVVFFARITFATNGDQMIPKSDQPTSQRTDPRGETCHSIRRQQFMPKASHHPGLRHSRFTHHPDQLTNNRNTFPATLWWPISYRIAESGNCESSRRRIDSQEFQEFNLKNSPVTRRRPQL